MEGEVHASPHLSYPVDTDDPEYVSKLSTILVATIQETRDSISQIEYLFCNQLYPDFQLKSKSLQKVYSEAKKAAEEEWKEKERDMLMQIETLQISNQKILQENQYLKLENRELGNIQTPSPKCIKELEEENHLLQKKTRILDLEAEELRRELRSKNKIIEEKTEGQTMLLQMVKSKASRISEIERKMQESDGKTIKLLEKHKCLEMERDGYQKELQDKIKQINKWTELQESMFNRIELQASEIGNKKKLLNDFEKENALLTGQLRTLEDKFNDLQKELLERSDELEEERKMRHANSPEMLKTRQEVEHLREEKGLLLDKLRGLEEELNRLQEELREKRTGPTEAIELHVQLLKQIESKNLEIQSEKKKRKDLMELYKKLKSQYNFLCTRLGPPSDNILSTTSSEAARGSLDQNQNLLRSPGMESKVPTTTVPGSELAIHNGDQHNLDNKEEVGFNQRPSSSSLSSPSSPVAPPPVRNVKSSPLSGSKRPISHWRDTRPSKNRNGPDPHDDFLDTPLENIKGNLSKATKGEVHHLPGPVPKDMNFDSSDDETQDVSANLALQKQQQASAARGPGTNKGFKFVEPVRKKAERESLKGIECKQCKKFYDAVLPDGGGNNGDSNKQNLRCEHHDGVSRHRYKYAPPLTPEGFWNIGFESEM